jgi:hypothetical protein
MDKAYFNDTGWAECCATISHTVDEQLDIVQDCGGRPWYFLAFALAQVIALQDNPMGIMREVTRELRAMVPQIMDDLKEIEEIDCTP